MDLKEIVCENMEYINLARVMVQWISLVNPIIDLGDPEKTGLLIYLVGMFC
jgi:hypothetical protein